MKPNTSFFEQNRQSLAWLVDKNAKAVLSRRQLLKSAAGASAVAALPVFAFTPTAQQTLLALTKTDPWLTLDATLQHLLPKSTSGPSATEINALAYLYQVMTVQPTEQDEKDFIVNGVGWLNNYANSELGKAFVFLSYEQKESLLRGISRSFAGENWLNTLLGYTLEAMLCAPAYGGNPQGIGWQWLAHQAGFPLPKVGQRYFELPPRSTINKLTAEQSISHANNTAMHVAKLNSISTTKS